MQKETLRKITDAVLDKILQKSDDGVYDESLIVAIESYISEKQLVKKWQESGFSDDFLDVWLKMYLSPVKDLPFNEACSWFVNRGIHRQVESAVAVFRSINDGNKRYSESEIKKMYNDFRNLIAPLIPNPNYDIYVEQAMLVARTETEKYLDSLSN